MKQKLFVSMLVLALMISFFPTSNVRADVAPPETPPGANVTPGDEVTQVRMVAETVLLDIRQDPVDEKGAVAYTTATFTMHNLGSDAETMRARFPLSFAGGASDGFGKYPEIDDIAVKVNGKSVRATREMQSPVAADGDSALERDEVPWSVFEATFPPGEDVTIEVKYTTSGFGYYPYEAFKYILETGAGWKDTIGSADIIVRLPYEATRYNVWLPDETTGYSQTTRGAVLNGNEVIWHFDNFEPGSADNIEVTIVSPSLWQKMLKETTTVTKDPNDGEAWGRLGKAYKEIAVMSKGYPRSDADGLELLQLSGDAYEKCLALLPDDSLWQFGYADLLWSHYYFNIYLANMPDTDGLLPKILIALKTSLELDPNNQRASDLLSWISSSVPDAVVNEGAAGYVYLALTATPQAPTPYQVASETPTVEPTEAIIFVSPTSEVAPTSPSSTSTAASSEPSAKSPLCGGTAFILPLVLGALWWKRRFV